MGSIVTEPPEEEIYYPEGPRVPDGDMQTRRRMELFYALEHCFKRRGNAEAWVCCNINVYYKKGDPEVVVAAELAVAFGVDAAAQKTEDTFRVWDAGAAPCFALEIASPDTVDVDLYDKPDKYAELGVEEYWRLDPTGGDLLDPPLQGETRVSGCWEPIEVTPDVGGGLRGRSSVLGLDLCWQPPKLRLWDITERAWIPDPDDQYAALKAAEARTAAIEARTAAIEAETAKHIAALKAEEARTAAAEAETAEHAAALKAAEAKRAELRAHLPRTPAEPGE